MTYYAPSGTLKSLACRRRHWRQSRVLHCAARSVLYIKSCDHTTRPLTHAPENGSRNGAINSTPGSSASFSCRCTTSNVVDCLRLPNTALSPAPSFLYGCKEKRPPCPWRRFNRSKADEKSFKKKIEKVILLATQCHMAKLRHTEKPGGFCGVINEVWAVDLFGNWRLKI